MASSEVTYHVVPHVSVEVLWVLELTTQLIGLLLVQTVHWKHCGFG